MAENDNQDQRIHELAKEVAVLRADMNTKQAENESALDRLRADMANWKTDMANWKTDMARRDKDNLRWQIGLWVAAVVILGVIIRWPSVPAVTG